MSRCTAAADMCCLPGVSEDFFSFIDRHRDDSPDRLRLRFHGKDPGFDVGLAITQIECRRKFAVKLAATLSRSGEFMFPSLLSGEQSTSDALAAYHATLAGDGGSVADLTCGLGIDAFSLARKARSVTAVDIEPAKTDFLRHNARVLGVDNIVAVRADCRDFLRDAPDGAFDTLFIDPARRGDDGRRLYAISDCSPDVTELIPQLRRVCRRLVVKMSPMLDVTRTLACLPQLTSLIAVGTTTECKELVGVADFDARDVNTAEVKAVTLDGDGEVVADFSYEFGSAMGEAVVGMPSVGDILYVPYPAVMKTAPFALLSRAFGAAQCHAGTHLFFSCGECAGFPGSPLVIEDIIPYHSREIKRVAGKYPRAGVAVRNFPVSADVLRARLGVGESDVRRIFGVTLADGARYMIVASLRPVDCKKNDA